MPARSRRLPVHDYRARRGRPRERHSERADHRRQPADRRHATSSSQTLRYFLKDKANNNATNLFQNGADDDTFTGDLAARADVHDRRRRPARPRHDELSVGPLLLQGPSIGIADVGFQDGMLVLTIAIGLDRACLNFGGGAANGAPGTGPTAAVELGDHRRPRRDPRNLRRGDRPVLAPERPVQGRRARQVQPAHRRSRGRVPDVVTIKAQGIEVNYDPAGDRESGARQDHECERHVPEVQRRGLDRPDSGVREQPGHSGSRRPPERLLDRPGAAEVRRHAGARHAPLTTTNSQPFISFGGILEFDDLRIGVKNFSVTFGTSVSFNGTIFVASGGARFLPGKPFGHDHRPQHRRRQNADGTPNDEAIRLELSFKPTARSTLSSSRSTRSRSSIGTLRHADGARLPAQHGRRRRRRRWSRSSRSARRSRSARSRLPARRATSRSWATARSRPRRASASSCPSAAPPATRSSGRASCRSGSTRSASSGHDIEHHPEDFVLTLSASVTGIKGVRASSSRGSIQGIKIQPSLLAAGQVPDHRHRLDRRDRQGQRCSAASSTRGSSAAS